jgi:hypothetical protein
MPKFIFAYNVIRKTNEYSKQLSTFDCNGQRSSTACSRHVTEPEPLSTEILIAWLKRTAKVHNLH